ncbi:MAG: TIGR00282 family metallophosphoesterase [SAR202 cluster bacterium]|nr:TIGR00282 family metallophosphoesterase [SAR202 cluster bacterium]
MRVMMIGDVIGRPGREAVTRLVPALRDEYAIDLVVANGENSAGGIGITPDTAHELLSAQVDVITSGNHIWKKKEIIPFLKEEMPVLRPANYPPGSPGRGFINLGDVIVVNLMGRVFMEALDCPFREADRILNEVKGPNAPKIVLVDFHAEATSEKQAMAWYLAGRVSAVVGTHTHVPTADTRIIADRTAFVSDLGMVGPRDSVIGVNAAPVIEKFLTQMPRSFDVASGPVMFNSVLIDIDASTGRATAIQRLDRQVD